MVQVIGNYYVGVAGNEQFDTSATANAGAVGLDGHDRIFSANASNANTFDGGRGADNLFFAIGGGGPASGSLYGGEGNDLVSGSAGQDSMYGGDGDDWIDGNWQNNGADDDGLYGGSGRDALFGKGGDDVIYGGDGDDKGQIATASPTTWQDNQVNFTTDAGLYGGDGDDFLDGGRGADSLFGGLGNDLMSGGAGADKFVFDAALGATNIDRVRDFSMDDGDSIVLSAAIFTEIGPSLEKKEFVIGKRAKDANDYIVLNQKKGTVAYDGDGKGGEKAVVFATIEKGMILAHTDFDIAT